METMIQAPTEGHIDRIEHALNRQLRRQNARRRYQPTIQAVRTRLIEEDLGAGYGCTECGSHYHLEDACQAQTCVHCGTKSCYGDCRDCWYCDTYPCRCVSSVDGAGLVQMHPADDGEVSCYTLEDYLDDIDAYEASFHDEVAWTPMPAEADAGERITPEATIMAPHTSPHGPRLVHSFNRLLSWNPLSNMKHRREQNAERRLERERSDAADRDRIARGWDH
jgi:hypothetical protein